MSADTWFLIAVIGFTLSGVSLIAAIFMFIKLNIPSIIGDLSGKKVAREIKALREASAKSLNNPAVPAYPGTRNRSSKTMRLPKAPTSDKPLTPSAPPASSAPATDVLTAGATDVLDAGATDILSDSGATDILEDPTLATSVLHESVTAPMPGGGTFAPVISGTVQPVPFTVTRSLIVVHTSETI